MSKCGVTGYSAHWIRASFKPMVCRVIVDSEEDGERERFKRISSIKIRSKHESVSASDLDISTGLEQLSLWSKDGPLSPEAIASSRAAMLAEQQRYDTASLFFLVSQTVCV